MIHREIKVVADSLEEARKKAKEAVPEDMFLVAAEVVSDGSQIRTIKAGAETSAAAMIAAEAKLPHDVCVIERRELVTSEKRTISIEADDEPTARLKTKSQIRGGEAIVAFRQAAEGGKGFLGIGKKANTYEVELAQAAVAEIIFRDQAVMSLLIGDRDFMLLTAVERGDAAEAHELLADGANPNAVDVTGKTVLSVAAAQGHEQLLVELITAGANAGEEAGQLALFNAAAAGHAELLKILLHAGADVNASNGRR